MCGDELTTFAARTLQPRLEMYAPFNVNAQCHEGSSTSQNAWYRGVAYEVVTSAQT